METLNFFYHFTYLPNVRNSEQFIILLFPTFVPRKKEITPKWNIVITVETLLSVTSQLGNIIKSSDKYHRRYGERRVKTCTYHFTLSLLEGKKNHLGPEKISTVMTIMNQALWLETHECRDCHRFWKCGNVWSARKLKASAEKRTLRIVHWKKKLFPSFILNVG